MGPYLGKNVSLYNLLALEDDQKSLAIFHILEDGEAR